MLEEVHEPLLIQLSFFQWTPQGRTATEQTLRGGTQPPRHTNALNEGQGINPGYTSPIGVGPFPFLQRSTKARVSTPATHGLFRSARLRDTPLNEGQGINPGYTISRVVPSPRSNRRSTKARVSTPATLLRRRPAGQPAGTLNEGQGINPGYTNRELAIEYTWEIAQRRPGYQPRLHRASKIEETEEEGRSTKARVSTPATHPSTKVGSPPTVVAQRRPGYQPRLHLRGR